MTKADIVSEIAEKTGLRRYEVQEVVDAFLETVKESLENGNPIYLRGFGTFTFKKRAKKVARNIAKNEPIVVPEHYIPELRFSRQIVNKIKKDKELAKKLDQAEGK